MSAISARAEKGRVKIRLEGNKPNEFAEAGMPPDQAMLLIMEIIAAIKEATK